MGYQITGIELNDENGIYYWNSFHNQITVTVSTLPPIGNDVSILGGSIRLMAKVGDGSYLPLGNSQSISEDENDYPTQFLFTVQNTNLSNTGFDQLTGLDEGSIVSIAAVIYDAAENGSTPSTIDNISLTVDQESPISGTIQLTTEITGDGNSKLVQGYWNIDTYRLNVLLEDLTNKDDRIEYGTVQLRGNISSNDLWIDLGTLKRITGDLTDFSIFVTDQNGWEATGDGIEDIPADFSLED